VGEDAVEVEGVRGDEQMAQQVQAQVGVGCGGRGRVEVDLDGLEVDVHGTTRVGTEKRLELGGRDVPLTSVEPAELGRGEPGVERHTAIRHRDESVPPGCAHGVQGTDP
jgi:hypothetical protein